MINRWFEAPDAGECEKVMTWMDLPAVSRELPVLIAGPTASGKSALAMEIAARDGRVVVNADALQVYGNWRVLTARPTLADEAAVVHALYGHVARDGVWSVGHWLRQAVALLDRPVVIVGGTGLYFSALTNGLAEVPEIPAEVRAAADARRKAGDLAGLVADLDAETAARTDLANPVRVQRAWEVLRTTGRGLVWWQQQATAPALPLARSEALVLRPEVDWLNARIDSRFSAMLDGGALDEARAEMPFWDPDRPSSRAIGAADLIAYLRGDTDLAAARDAATLATRRYAKRQRTWFRSHMAAWRSLVPR